MGASPETCMSAKRFGEEGVDLFCISFHQRRGPGAVGHEGEIGQVPGQRLRRLRRANRRGLPS